MLIQSDSRKPERDCLVQLPLREQQAKVSNFVKLIKIVSYFIKDKWNHVLFWVSVSKPSLKIGVQKIHHDQVANLT